MKATKQKIVTELPVIRVDVSEPGATLRKGRLGCELGTNLKFSADGLQSYFFAQWDPTLYDALLIAAAVEYCDRVKRRPTYGWGREIELRIPVHNPALWNRDDVRDALHDVLNFLTGDQWRIDFCARRNPEPCPRQDQFSLSTDVEAVIPFSDGLDSRAVAGLLEQELGAKFVRVRLGSRRLSADATPPRKMAFTAVPYEIRADRPRFVESSVRSRGFKFTLISGLAAYLSGAARVVMPESGQGALGPALVTVGHAYPDYRNHPRFTARMATFLFALLGRRIEFEFPRLWHTKAQTLNEFIEQCEDGAASLLATRSCWQHSWHVSVDNKARQCGICAACMLRRQSIHAAGLSEPESTYVWGNLGAPDFESGAAASFERAKITNAMNEHAIAGTLHLDHLAGLRSAQVHKPTLSHAAFHLGRCIGLSTDEARHRLDRLLLQHEKEWRAFMHALGKKSFVANWAAGE